MATRAQGPHIPPPYDVADVAAWQAIERGDATQHQQQRALKWLIEQAAGTYQMQYYDTDRATSFALGRAFVGQQIVKLLRLNASALRRPDDLQTTPPRPES